MGKPWEKENGGIVELDGIFPLVNIQTTMENHHVQWKNPLEMSCKPPIWSYHLAISQGY